MFKRISLFVLTNILVVSTLLVITQLTGLGSYVDKQGGNLTFIAILSVVFGFAGSFISLLISKWLAKMMMGIRIISPSTSDPFERWLIDEVHQMSRDAGLKTMPEVGIYNSGEVNAFATGPSKSNSLVAFSSGLLNSMDRSGIRGVAAHEVSHIANGDMVTMSLLQGVINTFVIFFARILALVASAAMDPERRGGIQFLIIMLFQFVFSILGTMVVMSYSRWREFHADAGSSRLVGKESMITALRQLQRTKEYVDTRQEALATFKIAGPAGMFFKLFASHPPLEDRIAALEKGSY